MPKRILSLIFFLFYTSAFGQEDFTWWNNIHHWDGHTPWVNYTQFSTSYMGPNALPVPDITTGQLKKSFTVEAGVAQHFHKGDNTTNGILDLFFPVLGRAMLEIYYVPVEIYKMDTATRDIRAARDYDGKGVAVGDFYVNAHFQIIKEKKGYPDVTLRVGLRTASGTNLEALRYTDAPGYFFDLSEGKTFVCNKNISMRPYLMLGFYCWQTYNIDKRQDDAFMYGVGASFYFKKFIIDENIGGYNGWQGNGDKPIVNKLSIATNYSKLNSKILFQYGLHDYPYTSVVASIIVNIPNLFSETVR